jgi:hypothetical protein
MFDIALPCEGMGPAEVVAALEKQIGGLSLDGAVVQLRLDSIQRDVWHSLDLVAVNEMLDRCLHVVLRPGRGGLVVAGEESEADISFAAFARREMPRGVDPDAVVRRARGYLDDAAAAEAEGEAAA